MRSRYLPTSLISSRMSASSVGISFQLCQVPVALRTLSSLATTSFSMRQSWPASLTATSSRRPRSRSRSVKASTTTSSAGISRAGSSVPATVPGALSGTVKCLRRATIRPPDSGRQVTSPGELLRGHAARPRAADGARAHRHVVEALAREIERGDLQRHLRRSRALAVARTREQRAPAVEVRVRKAAGHADAVALGERRRLVEGNRGAAEHELVALPDALDLRARGAPQADLHLVAAAPECALGAERALEPERQHFRGTLRQRRGQIEPETGELRFDRRASPRGRGPR